MLTLMGRTLRIGCGQHLFVDRSVGFLYNKNEKYKDYSLLGRIIIVQVGRDLLSGGNYG